LPYTRASQSGVAQIAVSYGKPVIISKVGGLKETLQNYNGVFFVEPGNSQQIRDKILECFKKKNKNYDYSLDLGDVAIKYKNILQNAC